MITREDRLQLIKDYKDTFGPPHGQRVLEDLATQGYEKALTYIQGDPNASAFNEGKRFMILHIRRLVDADMMAVI